MLPQNPTFYLCNNFIMPSKIVLRPNLIIPIISQNFIMSFKMVLNPILTFLITSYNSLILILHYLLVVLNPRVKGPKAARSLPSLWVKTPSVARKLPQVCGVPDPVAECLLRPGLCFLQFPPNAPRLLSPSAANLLAQFALASVVNLLAQSFLHSSIMLVKTTNMFCSILLCTVPLYLLQLLTLLCLINSPYSNRSLNWFLMCILTFMCMHNLQIFLNLHQQTHILGHPHERVSMYLLMELLMCLHS